MSGETTSKHVKGATEVLLLLPIKPGFVQVSTLMSYSMRLSKLLQVLFGLRKAATEAETLEPPGPIERLQTIYSVQWTVLEAQQQLLVAATFDRSWEEYFRLLRDKTGSLLDAIFCHCVGHEEGHTSRDGLEGFTSWLRQHQVPCDFFYVATPDLTTDDLRLLKKLATTGKTAGLAVGSVESEAAQHPPRGAANPDLNALYSALTGLYDLRNRLFSEQEISKFLDPAMGSLLKDRHIPVELGSVLPAPVRDWLKSVMRPRDPVAAAVTKPDLHGAEIQANILTPYTGVTHGCVVLLRCDDAEAERKLLRRLAESVTFQSSATKNKAHVNVGLTYAGLQRLGLETDVLQRFPKAFREGMEQRAGLIGDVGENLPHAWQQPVANWNGNATGTLVPLSTIDVLVTIQAAAEPSEGDHLWSKKHPLYREVKKLIDGNPGVHIVHVQALRRSFEQQGGRQLVREHFGFVDGTSGSQPVPNASLDGADLTAQAAPGDVVPLGELLLGYPGNDGETQSCPYAHASKPTDLFMNGTFMVVRKLEQDVAAFQNYVTQSAAGLDMPPERLKESIAGRRLDGRPLIGETDSNDFNYEQDKDGARCPLHSHIRRANPRTQVGAPIPRIMRRGFSYGKKDDAASEKGLMFMAYNASLSEQFEVIQRWINGGNSTGLLSTQRDLLTAESVYEAVPYWLKNNGKYKKLPAPDAPFVTLRWGAYVFVPSRSAIRVLAATPKVTAPVVAASAQVGAQAGAEPAGVSPLATAGLTIIASLEPLERAAKELAQQAQNTGDPELKLRAQAARETVVKTWKKIIEEPGAVAQTRAVWEAVRERRTQETSYGVLVGNLECAREVLEDDGTRFSACEYVGRLDKTIGGHYLSLDRTASGSRGYAATSELPNQYITQKLSEKDGHAKAKDYASGFLQRVPVLGTRKIVSVIDLARVTVAKCAQAWFGLPSVKSDDDADWMMGLQDYIIASRYAFQPYPEDWVTAEAEQRGTEIRASFQGQPSGAMADYLRAHEYTDTQLIWQAMAGAVVAFAAPAVASIVTIAQQWMDSGELFRLAGDASPADAARLRPAVIEALSRTPVPSLLYRTAREKAELDNEAIRASTPVVIGLGALYEEAVAKREDQPEKWLFGGDHGGARDTGKPAHGCPARATALAVMTGTFAALLEQRDVRLEREFVVSCAAPSAKGPSAYSRA